MTGEQYCDSGPDVERETCRICGQVISRTRRFFRDDPLPSGESPGWVHQECLLKEARQKCSNRMDNNAQD